MWFFQPKNEGIFFFFFFLGFKTPLILLFFWEKFTNFFYIEVFEKPLVVSNVLFGEKIVISSLVSFTFFSLMDDDEVLVVVYFLTFIELLKVFFKTKLVNHFLKFES